jgi:hypothetical protein
MDMSRNLPTSGRINEPKFGRKRATHASHQHVENPSSGEAHKRKFDAGVQETVMLGVFAGWIKSAPSGRSPWWSC